MLEMTTLKCLILDISTGSQFLRTNEILQISFWKLFKYSLKLLTLLTSLDLIKDTFNSPLTLLPRISLKNENNFYYAFWKIPYMLLYLFISCILFYWQTLVCNAVRLRGRVYPSSTGDYVVSFFLRTII